VNKIVASATQLHCSKVHFTSRLLTYNYPLPAARAQTKTS